MGTHIYLFTTLSKRERHKGATPSIPKTVRHTWAATIINNNSNLMNCLSATNSWRVAAAAAAAACAEFQSRPETANCNGIGVWSLAVCLSVCLFTEWVIMDLHIWCSCCGTAGKDETPLLLTLYVLLPWCQMRVSGNKQIKHAGCYSYRHFWIRCRGVKCVGHMFFWVMSSRRWCLSIRLWW